MSKKKIHIKYKNSAQGRRFARLFPDMSVPMLFAVAEAAALLLMCIILHSFIETAQNKQVIDSICFAALPLYILSAGVMTLVYWIKNIKTRRAQIEEGLFESEIYDLFRTVIDLPYAISDASGRVKIVNGALGDILGAKSALGGMELEDFCSVPIKTVISNAKNRDLYLNDSIYDMPEEADLHQSTVTRLSDGRRYEVISYIFKVRGGNYYFIVFRDVEDLLALSQKYFDESSVVAYIFLDNLQELTQYVRADYRSASAEVENILKDWAEGMGGFIREYTRDKYIALFSNKELDRQIQNEFDIQKKIMSLKIGDNSFPVTISMGISSIGDSLGEKEANASRALDMAIRRGGNQVAIRREDSVGYIFFGGTHKTIENNTTIISRVSGEILAEKINAASNVLIMGHASPDFDSVGSCVGIARFAMSVIEEKLTDDPNAEAIPVNVVIDKDSEAFKTCLEQLSPLKTYEDVFIGKDMASDLVSEDTVLIICDVNNPYIYEAPQLAKTVSRIALIDHHRLADALPYDPFLQFVETTKSSASEIVSEMLYHSRYADLLHKEEAEVLLSGIMLDTNNFTRNAGAGTFEITHYLYSRGAHTGVVREFFNESFDALLTISEFESKARLYRDDIAISWMTLEKDSGQEERVIASKVADNLLKIKGVKASFALVKVDNDVVISGRSKGEVNVQLILERLKGGGHFDIAGAQVKNTGLTRSCELLKAAIDEYFKFDHHIR